MSHIFISYSRKDSAIAKEIVTNLRSAGFVTWQDIDAIKGGEIWRTAMKQGIQQCGVFLLLWSAQSAASTVVPEEIELAMAASKLIVPLRLDGTPLTNDLQNRNAIEWSAGPKALIRSLPGELRRQTSGFDSTLPMRDQPEARMFNVDDTRMVSAPLLHSSECNAHVVAPVDMVIGQPAHLALCLQFTRKRGDLFVADVFRYMNTFDADDQVPFVALVISGPEKVDDTHWLDNFNPVHWIDALDTTTEAVTTLTETRQPTLHVFNLAPASLMLALGTRLYRFFRLNLYNYIDPRDRGETSPAYQRVLTL
jgi:hypothetical protein